MVAVAAVITKATSTAVADVPLSFLSMTMGECKLSTVRRSSSTVSSIIFTERIGNSKKMKLSSKLLQLQQMTTSNSMTLPNKCFLSTVSSSSSNNNGKISPFSLIRKSSNTRQQSQQPQQQQQQAQQQSQQHPAHHYIAGGMPCDPRAPAYHLAEYGEESLHSLVLIRHGESEWNKENKYTGW
jgi:hypothetical protein